MAKITYVGEESEITEAGIHFVRGKAVDVPDDHPRLAKLRSNPTFSAEKPAPKASAEEATEPGPLDQSVEKLTAYLDGVDDVEEIDRLIEAERGGKSRVGALDALEARRSALETPEE